MTAAKVAIDVVGMTVAFAMIVNGFRWFVRGFGAWYDVRERLDAIGADPTWKPWEPGLGMGLYLLVHPPAAEGTSELDRADVEGRTAIARCWLWFGGGIATGAVVILAQRL